MTHIFGLTKNTYGLGVIINLGYILFMTLGTWSMLFSLLTMFACVMAYNTLDRIEKEEKQDAFGVLFDSTKETNATNNS